MSRQRQFAPKVNKFVITRHAAHQAMCASEIMWSFRGFGRPARYPDAGRGRPSNKPDKQRRRVDFRQMRPTFTSGAGAGPKDFAAFPFKRPALHRSDESGRDRAVTTSGAALR